ncbi:MAG: aspartate/glutamate racemase family protein [bacterium]|nr:aspartate/glutamate racemase family protein [bacterium]
MHSNRSIGLDFSFIRRMAVTCLLLCLISMTDLIASSLSGHSLKSAGLSGRKTLTVLITDSGLGGMSVLATIEHRLQQCHLADRVKLVFANALPDNDHTYNQMATLEAKATTFSAALDGFVLRYHPDLILIACNTLSVVYPHTAFAADPSVPVYGIVDLGASLIASHMAADSAGDVVILGTPTTAESNAHRRQLEAAGISSSRIIVQGCEQLETEIQADPSSDIVQTMIDMYAQEALSRRNSNRQGELAVALCCTHYSYARDHFQRAFAALTSQPVAIIDPNRAMADALFEGADCASATATAIEVEVISRAKVAPNDIAAIARMLESESPAAAAALRNFTLDTTLFAYRPK